MAQRMVGDHQIGRERTEHLPTDENLVEAAQQDITDSIAELVTRYTPLVVAKASQYRRMGLEVEDLAQEGMLGLLRAVRAWSPEGGSGFRTFASVCITNRIRSFVRAFYRNKNTPLAGYTPLDEVQENHLATGQADDPEELFILWEEHQHRQQQIVALLSGFERSVLQLHLDGLSYGEIANHLACTTKAVDNALQRVRRKLHAAE